MSQPIRASAIAALAICALISSGCTSPSASPVPSGSLPPNKPVYINYPATGATIAASEIQVTITVTGRSIVDKIGKPAKAGEVHIIYYLDVNPIPTQMGKPATTPDRDSYFVTTQTLHRWDGVSVGKHILGVQLVNNDDTPLSPPEVDQIRVTVTKGTS